MDEAAVSECELIQAKLQGLYDEVLTLTKKSPGDPFNKFKVTLVNGVVAAANGLLTAQGMATPIGGFEELDDVTLPTNSDVVLVLSQYLQCLEKLRADNVMQSGGPWYWVIDGERSTRRTAPPRRIV
jgi:hypothetical protein